MTRPGRFTAGRLTTGRLTTVPGVPTSAVTGAGVRGVVTGAGVRGAATGTSSRASAPSAPRGTTKTTVDPLPDTMPRPHSEPIRRLTSRSEMTQKSLQPPRHRLDLAQQLGQSLKRRNQIINMPPHDLHLLGHPGTDLSHHRRSPQPETEHLFQHRLAEHAERLGDRITHHVMNELDNKPGDPQTSGDTMSQIPQRLQSSRQVRPLRPPRVSRLTDLALHIPLDRVPQVLRLLFKMIRNIHPRLRTRPYRVRIPGQLVKNLRKRVNMLQNPPGYRPNSRGQWIERQRHNIARQTRARQRPLSPRPIANRSRQIGNILTQTRPRPKRRRILALRDQRLLTHNPAPPHPAPAPRNKTTGPTGHHRTEPNHTSQNNHRARGTHHPPYTTQPPTQHPRDHTRPATDHPPSRPPTESAPHDAYVDAGGRDHAPAPAPPRRTSPRHARTRQPHDTRPHHRARTRPLVELTTSQTPTDHHRPPLHPPSPQTNPSTKDRTHTGRHHMRHPRSTLQQTVPVSFPAPRSLGVRGWAVGSLPAPTHYDPAGARPSPGMGPSPVPRCCRLRSHPAADEPLLRKERLCRATR